MFSCRLARYSRIALCRREDEEAEEDEVDEEDFEGVVDDEGVDVGFSTCGRFLPRVCLSPLTAFVDSCWSSSLVSHASFHAFAFSHTDSFSTRFFNSFAKFAPLILFTFAL